MTATAAAGLPVLTSITRYPVKSCRGEQLASAVMEPQGLAGDRRWMLVDDAGVALTARTCPGLLLVVPRLTASGLAVTAPGQPSVEVAVPGAGRRLQVAIWGDVVAATLAADEATSWFSAAIGRSVRLVYLDDPLRRVVDPKRGQAGDVVSFADGYPVLLAAAESLAALNAWVAEGRRADEGPLPMTRFRPNLVVAGAPAWSEDRWRRVRIGEVSFRAVKACERCVLTMVDPETATKTKEPLYSLARHRQWDHKTWFAVNLIPNNPGTTLQLGDQVEVLAETDDAEPQR